LLDQKQHQKTNNMKKNYTLVIVLFLLFIHQPYAQPWLQNNAIFNPSGIPSLPFSQPRFADLDNDGDLDMILGNINDTPLYLENTGNVNNPVFQAGADLFSVVDPLDAEMAVFKDIDGDEDLDMISGGYTGINLYQNIGNAENPLFEKAEGFFNSLQAGASPVVDLSDLDEDGDLDLVVGFSEGGMVKIYENTGNQLVAEFSESNSYEVADVGLYAYPYFADLDADNDHDLLVGRDGFGFYYYENIGTPQSADWEENSGLFSGLGMETYWNSPALIDLNGNGTFDLIFGTSSGPLKYYDNSGTAEEAAWSENTSLFGGVIDIGGASNPVFYDYDNDGDLDMFTGSQMGDIKYFENTGNSSGPSWSENSAPFTSLKHSIYSAVAVGDVNNDGQMDAIVGDLSGNLFYHKNSGLGFVYEASYLSGISLGGWSAPRLIDFDEDGDLDIVAGAENGTLTYLENQGDAANPDWVQISGVFSGIDVGSSCVPTLSDVDFDGDFDLVCGDLTGDLSFFENVEGSWVEDGSFVAELVVDQNATPAFADLDGDGDPDMIIGEYAGTFSYYENRLMVVGVESNIIDPKDIQLFPNPVKDNLFVEMNFIQSSDLIYEIYQINGTLVLNKKVSMAKGEHILELELETLNRGVYLLKLSTIEGNTVKKIVKE
jgi:hypothetical protein